MTSPRGRHEHHARPSDNEKAASLDEALESVGEGYVPGPGPINRPGRLFLDGDTMALDRPAFDKDRIRN